MYGFAAFSYRRCRYCLMEVKWNVNLTGQTVSLPLDEGTRNAYSMSFKTRWWQAMELIRDFLECIAAQQACRHYRHRCGLADLLVR